MNTTLHPRTTIRLVTATGIGVAAGYCVVQALEEIHIYRRYLVLQSASDASLDAYFERTPAWMYEDRSNLYSAIGHEFANNPWIGMGFTAALLLLILFFSTISYLLLRFWIMKLNDSEMGVSEPRTER